MATERRNLDEEIRQAKEIILGKNLSWNEFNSLFSITKFPSDLPARAMDSSYKSLLWQSYRIAKDQNQRKLAVSKWIKSFAEEENKKLSQVEKRKIETEKASSKFREIIAIWPFQDSQKESTILKGRLTKLGILMDEFRPEIIKRLEGLEKLNKEAKIFAFKRVNFQSGHRNPSAAQKEKVWNGSKTISSNFTMLRSRPSEIISLQVTVCNKCGEYSQESKLSFWWEIYPELNLDLLCDKCAENEGLVEKKQVTESRSRNISQEVRDDVWNRDGGRCVECGSNENLEFDHIIPHSKGGANTYRNIQLLCEKCNRSKSDNIG